MRVSLRHGIGRASKASAGLEESLCLCPVEDRREIESKAREGMVPGLPLDGYLLLVDYTGRMLREGKAVISREVSVILDRLGSDADSWEVRLRKLAGGRRPAGSVLRGESRAAEGGGRHAGYAPPGEPVRLPGPLSRSRGLARIGRASAPPTESAVGLLLTQIAYIPEKKGGVPLRAHNNTVSMFFYYNKHL